MPAWPADVAPADLRQPDGLSCGAASVVAARIVIDPSWRPADPVAEVLRTHRVLTAPTGADGRAQLPWPRGLGTPPWALARALETITGLEVRIQPARFTPGTAYDALVDRVADRPVGVYVGSAWLPRHVVLAIAATGDGEGVTVFDPSRGRLVTVPAQRWREHRVGVAGWSHFWAVC